MKFRPFSSIKVEDVKKELRDDFSRIFGQLNPFLLQFNNLFNRGIGIDNLQLSIVTALIEVDLTGKPKTQLILSKEGLEKFNGALIINVQKTSANSPFLTAAPFLEIVENQNAIEVKKLFGFPADVKFFVTFLLI